MKSEGGGPGLGGREGWAEGGCVSCVCVAANLLEALFTPGSEHPALAMMEPVSQPPHSLLQAAAG